MKKIRFISALIAVSTLFCVSAIAKDFEKSKTYQNSFKDVPETSWYAANVASVYELALMEGVSSDTFDTDSEMNVAQAITIAARLHSIYNDTEIPEVQGGRWFQKYIEYCLDKKIMTENQFESYSRSVLSYEMVQLFAAALPDEFYPAVNEINRVHDVPSQLFFHEDVLKFYNSGILNGNDKNGTFLPLSAITRKRAAVIISRVALPENRLTFTIEDINDTLTPKEFLELMDKQTVKDALDEIIMATSDDFEVTASLYRYFYNNYKDNSKSEDEVKATVEKELRAFAALHGLIENSDITVSREIYEAALFGYYQNRDAIFNDGSTYFDALDQIYLTDSAYALLSCDSILTSIAEVSFSNNITPDEVYDYALENGYIHASHILISNETEEAYRLALELRLKINDGADFDALLEEYGEDPGMKGRNSGYFFTRGTMVEPFEKAAYALEEGAVSNIIETDFGYHIIKRLPFTKEAFVNSPDFSTAAHEAGLLKFYTLLSEKEQLIKFTYAGNFDGLAQLLK